MSDIKMEVLKVAINNDASQEQLKALTEHLDAGNKEAVDGILQELYDTEIEKQTVLENPVLSSEEEVDFKTLPFERQKEIQADRWNAVEEQMREQSFFDKTGIPLSEKAKASAEINGALSAAQEKVRAAREYFQRSLSFKDRYESQTQLEQALKEMWALIEKAQELK